MPISKDNTEYENNYTKYVESLYRNRIEPIDDSLFSDNILPNQYTIMDRVDFTNYETYSIDPEGCEDADDAFSIYTENGILYLAIHIADPTHYINLNSKLWSNIVDKVVTQYPSNRKPLHMMPYEIMERSSLMVNKEGDIKNAITILTTIDEFTYKPSNIKILFTKIKVKVENGLSYNEACKQIYSNNTLFIGLKISNALQQVRGAKTIGIKLNEVSHSYIEYIDNTPFLYRNNDYEIQMKQMIAEFAIFANSFVGEYLKLNLDGMGIFRTCEAKDLLSNMYNLNGNELLNEIITNGIRAEYLSTNSSHDLVGMPEYSHFTSPIRRLSDCVCHYLLKFIYLKNKYNTIGNIVIPFSHSQLDVFSNKCLDITRKIKKIQYKDTKFRLIQTMFNMLLLRPQLKLSYYITSYSGAFLNILICKINDHNIHLSYTLKMKDCKIEPNNKNIFNVNITKVHPIKKFDEGSIPELDYDIKNKNNNSDHSH